VDTENPSRRVFTYEEAVALMPQVRRLTEDAYRRVEALGARFTPRGAEPHAGEVDEIVRAWAESLMRLGVEIKGLWLADFDNGAGYYCWRYPEPALHYFHSYEEGFAGRIRIH
jgi:hypothetical protein